MSMSGAMNAMDWIVLLALLFTLVFLAAWVFSPGLRAWIEKPKYRFLADVEAHDRRLR